MSKGNERYTVRIEPELIQEMEEVIVRTHLTRNEQPWTSSDFIRVAIREKLDKMERGRKPYGVRKKNGAPSDSPELPDEEGSGLNLNTVLTDDDDDGQEHEPEPKTETQGLENSPPPPPAEKSETDKWQEELNQLRKATRGE